MKNITLYIIILLSISNCSLNKVIKHHGVNALDQKKDKLIVNKTNKNDIEKLLGPASTKGVFDKDMWIFIERKTSSSKLLKLGKKELLVNNILIVEIDTKGLLSNKVFLNKDQVNNLEFTEAITQMNLTKRSFIYNFLNSMRQKINDPLGKKKIQF
jgi:outer membrane protein assembly factor BamE (lipoprotein component of BamABCDE complex)